MKLTILNSRRNVRGQWILVDGGQYIVGRQRPRGKIPEVDLPFDRQISHQHCRVYVENGKWWIEDLLSTNGTMLNDEKVETPTILINEDEIRIGKVLLIVEIQTQN